MVPDLLGRVNPSFMKQIFAIVSPKSRSISLLILVSTAEQILLSLLS
jgi:hypothetical protein